MCIRDRSISGACRKFRLYFCGGEILDELPGGGFLQGIFFVEHDHAGAGDRRAVLGIRIDARVIGNAKLEAIADLVEQRSDVGRGRREDGDLAGNERIGIGLDILKRARIVHGLPFGQERGQSAVVHLSLIHI